MTSETFFDQIQQHLHNNSPFVVYKKPKETVVKAMLQKNDRLYITSDYSECGFVFAPFDDREETVLIPSENSEMLSIDYEMFVSSKLSHHEIKYSETEKQQHVNLVQNGIEAIHNNQFSKVVLSRCETLYHYGVNALEIFKRLLNNYPSAFTYCWFHPKIGLWLGATPETLLQIEGNRFKTMALAGTQLDKGSLDIIWQDKEVQEQKLVTDFIVEGLKDSVTTLSVSNPITVKAGSLLHIKTHISGTMDSNLRLILKRLHPTPAVCGMPKEKAKQFILKHENYNREFYTGFLGELNLTQTISRNTNRRNVENNAYASLKKVSNLFVNLRCMQLKTKCTLIYVGGGITTDSIPEKEWEETVNKTQTIKGVLD